MLSYKSIYYASLLVHIGMDIVVMWVCFPLWRKRRLRFALLFAWAAWVSLVVCIVEHFAPLYPMETGTWEVLWSALRILSIAVMGLYATAVVLMVRHFFAVADTSPNPSGQLE